MSTRKKTITFGYCYRTSSHDIIRHDISAKFKILIIYCFNFETV